MGSVLSIDLAYKRIRDFGVCLIEEGQGHPRNVSFPSPSELGFRDPPKPKQIADAIFEFCRLGEIAIVLLDGPQGWKRPHNLVKHSRCCEAILNTPGKTGTQGRGKPKNYLPFLKFSIETFGCLVNLGGVLTPDPIITIPRGGLLVLESFPNSAWRKLCIKPLPSKRRATRRDIRHRLQRLQHLYGFRTQGFPNHDELQALVAGLAAPPILAGNHCGYIAEGSAPKRIRGAVCEGYIVNPRFAKRVV